MMNCSINKVPRIPLSNDRTIPMVGLGTYFGKPEQWNKDEVSQAVQSAIDLGYRAFDTAAIYGTESAVSEGIKNKIADGTLQRKDIFLTTKLPNYGLQPKYTRACFEESMRNLGMEYVDLYLMHFPWGALHPNDRTESHQLDLSSDFLKTWKVLEQFVVEGKVGALGVCNFNSRQIQRLLDNAEIKPVVNQIEVHPYLRNDRLVRYCQERGVQVTAYSPLGQHNMGGPSTVRSSWVSPLQNAVMLELAAKYNKTPAQLALRYQTQRNIVVIPMAADPIWQQENLNLFDFALSEEDMLKVASLDRDDRSLCFLNAKDHPEYPFNEEF